MFVSYLLGADEIAAEGQASMSNAETAMETKPALDRHSGS